MRRATSFLATTTATLLAAAGAALGTPVPASAQVTGVAAGAAGAAGWIGVKIDVTEVHHGDGRVESTLVIQGVVDGSPAARAGIRPGDEVVSLNGRAATLQAFSRLATGLRPGDRFWVTLARQGRSWEVGLQAVPRPAAELFTIPKDLVVRLDSAMQRLDSLRIRITRADGTDTDLVLTGSDASVVSLSEMSRIITVEADSTRTVLAPVGFGRAFWSGAVPSWPPDSAAQLPDPRDGLPFARFLVRDRDSTATARAVRVTQEAREIQAAREASESEGFRPLAPYIWGENRIAGAEVTPLNPELAAYFQVGRGLLVTDVTEGTPASEAGIQPGDVVTRANGSDVSTTDDLRKALSQPWGAPLVLHIVRRGVELDVRLPR